MTVMLVSTTLFSEGTKTVSPFSTTISGLLSAPDLNSGSFFNAPADQRVYFRIGNANTENLYFGFDWRDYVTTNPAPRLTNLYYRIFNPDGSLAAGPTLWNPT